MTLIRWWLFIVFMAGRAATALEPLSVQPDMPYTDLFPFTEVLEDRTGLLTREEVSSRTWEPVKGAGSYGFTETTYWFRISLQNTGTRSVGTNLIIDFPQLDQVWVYLPSNASPLELGDQVPFQTRPVNTRNFVVPLNVEPGQTIVYLRVATTSVLYVPLALTSPTRHLEILASIQIRLGFFYGVILILFIYYFVVFCSTLEPQYGWFSLILASLIGYSGMMDGLGFPFWPNALYWQNHATTIFIVVWNIALLRFSHHFLALSQGRWLSVRWFTFAWLVLLVGSLFVSVRIGLSVCVPFSSVTLCFVLGVAYVRLSQGVKMARYFLVGWSGFLLTALALSLSASGLFPAFHFLTLWGLKIATANLALFLSLGIAYRIQELHKVAEDHETKMLKARAENTAKSAFLAQMSHELRTPLNAVLGMVELLRDSPMNAEQHQRLQVVASAGNSLLSVINDILDYARLESNKVTLYPQAFDLRQLLDSCLNIVRLGFHKEGIQLTCDWPDGLPRRFIGDEARLKQVILNLLGNAIKFTEAGEVGIRVTATELETDEPKIVFSIHDTGIGIPEDQISKLFQPFSQVETGTSRRFGGTGLGLNISSQLVQLMGGELQAESEIGVGSVFTFSVRMQLAPLLGDRPVREEPTFYSDLSHLKVLVAEDNSVNAMVIKGFLRRVQITPVIAQNGQEALDLLKAQDHWDLILMDCEMPVMDGIQATKLIRDHEKVNKMKRARIVALTAHVLPEYRERCEQAGMDDFLAKPLVFEDLMRVIQALAYEQRTLPTSEVVFRKTE